MTASLPLVSVIVPAHNAMAFLPEAIASVRAQRYVPLEILLIDDGSSDGTADWAAAQTDLRLLRQVNLGPAAARNRGIAAAHGEVLAFLDADDLWTERSLIDRVELLQSDPHLQWACGKTLWLKGQRRSDGWDWTPQPEKSYPFALISAILCRRSLFDRVGLFNPGMRFGEDIDFHLRVLDSRSTMAWLDRPVHHYRQHDSNMTLADPDLNYRLVLEAARRSMLRRIAQRRTGAAHGLQR